MFEAIGEGHKILHQSGERGGVVSFETHKQDAEKWLANATDKASPALVRALHIIVELAERGKALETENADLRRELLRVGEKY